MPCCNLAAAPIFVFLTNLSLDSFYLMDNRFLTSLHCVNFVQEQFENVDITQPLPAASFDMTLKHYPIGQPTLLIY